MGRQTVELNGNCWSCMERQCADEDSGMCEKCLAADNSMSDALRIQKQRAELAEWLVSCLPATTHHKLALIEQFADRYRAIK